MTTKVVLAVLDCNFYVSFALGSRQLNPLALAWKAKRFKTLSSTYLLKEVESVLARDKFKPYIKREAIAAFLAAVESLAEPMLPKQPFPDFSDPKDRYLLAMLRDSQANVLVTGDKILLELERSEDKLILSPHTFVNSYLDGN